MSPWLNTISTPVVFHNWWCLTQGISCMVRRYLYLYIIIMRGYPNSFIYSTSFVPTLQFISDLPDFFTIFRNFDHFQDTLRIFHHFQDFWSLSASFRIFHHFEIFFIHFKEFLTLIRILDHFPDFSSFSRHFEALLGFFITFMIFMLFPDYFRLFTTFKIFVHFRDFSDSFPSLQNFKTQESIFCTAHF